MVMSWWLLLAYWLFLECVSSEQEAVTMRTLSYKPETSNTDSCKEEMGPCLMMLKQARMECNNTIILYYITLIWILSIASTCTLTRPPPHAPQSSDKGFV